ncbi:MAG: FecR family protein [bacterium]
MKGEAWILKGGAERWDYAAEEMIVARGDAIKTAEGQRVDVTFDDGTKLQVGGGTLIAIDRHEIGGDGARNLHLSMEQGRARAVVEKLAVSGSAFEVHTPTAVAGVRGTDFEVEIEDGESAVTVFEGEVEVENRAGAVREKIRLLANHMTRVRGGDVPVKPILLNKERVMKKRGEWAKRIREKGEGLSKEEAVVFLKAHMNGLPVEKGRQLVGQMKDNGLDFQDARLIAMLPSRGVSPAEAAEAIEVMDDRSLSGDDFRGLANDLRAMKEPGEMREKLRGIGDIAELALDRQIEKIGKKGRIEEKRDLEKIELLLSRLAPGDKRRPELEFLKTAVSKGIPPEKVRTIAQIMRGGHLRMRDAVLLLEAVKRGLDPEFVQLFTRRLHEAGVDFRTRDLFIRALSLGLKKEQVHAILEKMRTGGLTEEQARQKLEQFIRENVSSLEKTGDGGQNK